jgi:hypothetical protein
MRIRTRTAASALVIGAFIAAGCTGTGGGSSPIGASPIGSAPPPTATPAPTEITEAQAVAAVQAFVPQVKGLHVTGSDTSSSGPVYRVEAENVSAIVVKATGQVMSVLLLGAMASAPTVVLKPDQALAAATAYLAKHNVDATGLTGTVELLDHGEFQEYQITFLAVVNGVQLPDRVNVSVNPITGEIFSFGQYRHDIGPVPSPRLSLEDATAAAKAEEKDPGLTVTASTLAVVLNDAGTQQLVWELDATRSDGFYVKLNVDAISGAVTVTGRG